MKARPSTCLGKTKASVREALSQHQAHTTGTTVMVIIAILGVTCVICSILELSMGLMCMLVWD